MDGFRCKINCSVKLILKMNYLDVQLSYAKDNPDEINENIWDSIFSNSTSHSPFPRQQF